MNTTRINYKRKSSQIPQSEIRDLKRVLRNREEFLILNKVLNEELDNIKNNKKH